LDEKEGVRIMVSFKDQFGREKDRRVTWSETGEVGAGREPQTLRKARA